MSRSLPCWKSGGNVFTAVEEDPDISPGFPLRVINLTTGEMHAPFYPSWEELVDGEGLEPDNPNCYFGTLSVSMSEKTPWKKPKDWQ